MFKFIKNILRMVFYMFNKDSGLVKVWVSLILLGTYDYEDVPELLNLREEVRKVLIEVGYMTDETP